MSDMVISIAQEQDAEGIYALMEYARIENEKKGFFCADNMEYIREHILNPDKGFVLKAVSDGKIAGFLMIHIPHMDANNMASYKELPQKEYESVVHFDSAVVSPDYRGRHLMDCLLTKAEEILEDMPYKHYFVTVHPDNSNSYRNLVAHGFKVVTTTHKYGGLLRYVMYRQNC